MSQVEHAQDLFAQQKLPSGCSRSNHGNQRPGFAKTTSMSSDGGSSPNEEANIDSSDKKYRHKKVEQNRRETTKALLSELQGMLPNMDAYAPGSGINVVLESALDYVKQSRDVGQGKLENPKRKVKEEPEDSKEMIHVAQESCVVPVAGACSNICGLRYTTAYDGAPCGIVISRLDGTMLSCNKMFASLLAFPKPKVDGHTMFSLTVPADLPPTLQAVSSLLTGTHKAVTIRKRCYRQNGDLLNALVQITCIHKDNKPSHFICYLKEAEIEPSNQIELMESNRTSPAGSGGGSPMEPSV